MDQKNILYHSENILAMSKPSGIHGHPLRTSEQECLLLQCAVDFPNIMTICNKSQPQEGGLLHRIDQGTSGILLAARNLETYGRVRKYWKDPSTVKIYAAWVEGKLAKPFLVEGFISHSLKSKRKMIFRTQELKGQKSYKSVTEVYPVFYLENSTFVLIRIHTGFRHQIRVVLSTLGFPIVSDLLYSKSKNRLNDFELKPCMQKTLSIFEKINNKLTCSEKPLKELGENQFYLHSMYLKHGYIESEQFDDSLEINAPFPVYFNVSYEL